MEPKEEKPSPPLTLKDGKNIQKNQEISSATIEEALKETKTQKKKTPTKLKKSKPTKLIKRNQT